MAIYATITFPNNIQVQGQLVPGTFVAPAGSIGDGAMQTPASGVTGVASAKLQHRFCGVYSQPGVTFVERKVVHVARGQNGLVLEVKVGARVAAIGNATVTVDFMKGGITLLTATLTLDNTTAAYILKAASLIGSPTYTTGDVLEAVVTAVNAGTGTLPTGLFIEAHVQEDAV